MILDLLVGCWAFSGGPCLASLNEFYLHIKKKKPAGLGVLVLCWFWDGDEGPDGFSLFLLEEKKKEDVYSKKRNIKKEEGNIWIYRLKRNIDTGVREKRCDP